ncbi:hypothetical protein ABC733_15235 [Mangrovibacter sp. SLW1]
MRGLALGRGVLPVAGITFLDVDNDTNDNLLRLVSAEKHFALPVYAFLWMPAVCATSISVTTMMHQWVCQLPHQKIPRFLH